MRLFFYYVWEKFNSGAQLEVDARVLHSRSEAFRACLESDYSLCETISLHNTSAIKCMSPKSKKLVNDHDRPIL